MLRINSSVSSALSEGPSTRCKIPCNRITGGTATRMCRSEAPSETTNCNRSDIEYAIYMDGFESNRCLRLWNQVTSFVQAVLCADGAGCLGVGRAGINPHRQRSLE